MRKIYSLFVLLFMALISQAQVSVTATVGTTGPTTYTTLKAAFDAINAGTHKGAITVNITGNTTETATATLNPSTGASSYTGISVTTSGAFTITGNISSGIINLNGATNVSIDGNNTLQIINTSTTGAVVLLQNDASNNTVKNATLKGSTNSLTAGFPTSGVLFLGTGVTTGNDNNMFDNLNIDGGNLAVCLVYSGGSETTSAIQNSGNTIKNSRLKDNVNPTTAASIGLVLDGGNTGWTIEGNSHYYTAPVATAQQFVIRGFLILPSFTTDTHVVTGNFLGGNAPSAAGTATISASGANAVGYIGLDVETGGPGNIVSNNTVKNITLTYSFSGGSFGNAAIFSFIGGFNGTTTLSGNTVSDLNFSNMAGFMNISAIHVNGRVTAAGTFAGTFTLSNNTINNITTNSGGTAGDVQLHGIRLETSSAASLAATAIANPKFNVSGNTLTNMTSPFNGPNTLIRGIGTTTLQGGTQAAGTLSTALLFPKVDINTNTIHTFSTASGLAAYNAGVLTGIHFGGSNGATTNTADTQLIRQNTIYNFTGTNLDSGQVVIGILATLGKFDISRNKIYDLKNASTVAAENPGILGITTRNVSALSWVSNNFVSLGSGVTTDIRIHGIHQNFASTNSVEVLHNTVVITGTASGATTLPTAALVRGTETLGNTVQTPMVLRNNIFYNSRTGGTAPHFAVINSFTGTPLGWVSDYNNLYSANAATIAQWGTAQNTLTVYKTNAGDANSKSVTVSFINVANGDLHLSGASTSDVNLQAPPAGITIDIDGATRGATIVYMGADEPSSAGCTAPAITTQPAAQAACAGGNATFNVTATGTALTYQWRKAGSNISGATGASLVLNNITAGDAANYDVVISNACGSITSAAAALNLSAPTVITAQPTMQTGCVAGSATFAVAATGQGTLTYQWRKDGTNIAGATNASLVLNNLTAANAGTYSVIVTGACGPVTSGNALLVVNTCTAVIPVDENISSVKLLSNPVYSTATVRLNAQRSANVKWTVVDAQGRVVMSFSKPVNAGQNDIELQVSRLAAGLYQIAGETSKGRTTTLQMFKY